MVSSLFLLTCDVLCEKGFDATGGHGVVYGSGRGGNRGGTVYSARGGPSRTGTC